MRWWVASDDELRRNKRKGRWGRLVGGDTAGLIMDQVHSMLAPSISYKTFWPFSHSFRIWSTLAQCVEKSSISASHHAAGHPLHVLWLSYQWAIFLQFQVHPTMYLLNIQPVCIMIYHLFCWGKRNVSQYL